MKHDHTAFARPAAGLAYAGADPAVVEDRVRRFVPMVRAAAWHIHGGGRDGLEVDDLMQTGMLALTECARRHAGPGEDGFAAYAKLRVRGAMFDLVRRSLPEGRSAVRRRRQVAEARERLRMRLGREPMAAELAEEAGLSVPELTALEAGEVHLVQLDGAYDESDGAYADDRPDAFALLAGIEDGELLAEAIAQLPERLRLVLQLYFVEELNLKEIAAVLEVSVPRVHQLKAQALAKVRDLLEGG